MRVFKHGGVMTGRVNFVDDNNVFVGFDFTAHCCETFDYKVTTDEPICIEHVRALKTLSETDFPGFNFDTSYKLEHEDSVIGGESLSVTFKAVNGSGDSLFVTFINCHNGYYKHGFDMKSGDDIIHSGHL